MTALFFAPFSIFSRTFRKAKPTVDDTGRLDRVERRKIVADMIAAGACDSEFGAQMMMSVFPDQF